MEAVKINRFALNYVNYDFKKAVIAYLTEKE